VGLLLVEIREVIAPKALRPWEEPRKPEYLVESHLGRWQGALALGQEIALAIHHLDAQSATIGVRIHKGDDLTEGVGLHQCVRIQQQHQLARGDAHGLIVRPRKAHIVLVGNERHLRKLGLHHGHRSVHRIVVHHKDLCRYALAGHHHRLQARLEEVLHIVIDDDDGKLQAAALRVGEVGENETRKNHLASEFS
jgi:hypothetical protein